MEGSGRTVNPEQPIGSLWTLINVHKETLLAIDTAALSGEKLTLGALWRARRLPERRVRPNMCFMLVAYDESVSLFLVDGCFLCWNSDSYPLTENFKRVV